MITAFGWDYVRERGRAGTGTFRGLLLWFQFKKKKSRSGVELSLIFASLCGIWICFSASDRPAVLSSSYFCFGALSLLHVQWQQRENVVSRRCPQRCVSLSCNASAIVHSEQFFPPISQGRRLQKSYGGWEGHRCKCLICWGDLRSLRGINVTLRLNDS